jgi:2-hydroxy-3-keto-5-methylthiopentenyl-1-phosphate phosphatase
MSPTSPTYKALISSDWSECLSPNGPFDPIAFTYPELKTELMSVFRAYTGNTISLTDAYAKIAELLPAPLTRDHMDAYLKRSFTTYPGLADLIEWCLHRGAAFMINTTGTQGYFERAVASRLLPKVTAVASNPSIRYEGSDSPDRYRYAVMEIDDKPKNTEAFMKSIGLSPDKVVIIGDSGGDGAHFAWGSQAGAYTIGSMTKHSLSAYCESVGARIDYRFGLSYGPGEERDPEQEMKVSLTDLKSIIGEAVGI